MHCTAQESGDPRSDARVVATRTASAVTRTPAPLFRHVGNHPRVTATRHATRRAWRELVESVGW
jgi:hypothetical protein